MNNKALLLSLSALLVACSDDNISNSSSKSSAEKSCISSFIKTPCALLTTEVVKKEFSQFPADAEKKEIVQIKSCSYSWPSKGRIKIMKIAGREMEIPVSSEIGISWIKKKDIKTALPSFRNAYRTLSEEEKKRAAAAMQKALDERSEGLTESQKKMASGMSKGFLNNMKYESVEGVATAAAWGGAGAGGSSLRVLDGDTEFQLSVNISDVDADNKKLATSLAKSLITSCK